MAASFEYFGQTVAATLPQQPQTRAPQPVPAYVPPQPQTVAAPQQESKRVTVVWGAYVFAYACLVATLGAHMVSDGGWFIVLWWRLFGWTGLVDLPLALLPLSVVLTACALLTWGVAALVEMIVTGKKGTV